MKRITGMPSISVCMSMYNASAYLRECIDSVLSQTFTDFEFLIVDDGSTDDSTLIVESYSDARIRLVRNRHDYISSLNLLLEKAIGKYIARMDADDIMVKDRLQVQFDYMESHSHVDLVGSGMNYMDEMCTVYEPSITDRCLFPQDMLEDCCIAHPTVFVRSDVIRRSHLRYREEYKYAEDYRLWVEMLMNGLHLMNLKYPLLNYRVSANQISHTRCDEQAAITSRIQAELRQWIKEAKEQAIREEFRIPASKNKLTLIIPFLNEGEEVANTVRSARNTVGNRVDIIVINDCSTDGYDYESDLAGLNVSYVRNTVNIGSAASKEKGARLSVTPYFILLDAHMRFYDGRWLGRYVEELEKDDNRILCCQTKWLSKVDGTVREEHRTVTRGAFLQFDNATLMPGILWNVYRQKKLLDGDKIPAVLGATYGASKRFWNQIRGLQGLIHYGCEEAYISIKAYLMGGCCSFLEDVSIGHIYRDSAPYHQYQAENLYNYFWITHTLFPTSLRCLALGRCFRVYPELTRKLLKKMDAEHDTVQEYKSYYQKLQKRDFSFILSINDQFVASEENELGKKAGLLSNIVRFVMSDETSDLGICHGMMGKIVFLCNAFSVSHEPTIDIRATALFSMIEKYLLDCYCWNFRDGLSGIGWSLIYLQTHDFIDDIDDLLNIIDQRIICISARRIRDDSFERGIGGVMAYAAARIGYSRCKESTFPFEDDFMDELYDRAMSLKNESHLHDYRTYNYARQLAEMSARDTHWQVLRPELWEIFEFPDNVNENMKDWTISMQGCLGCGLSILLKYQKLLNAYTKKHEIKFL